MAAASNYLENKLADHIFRTTTFTQPSVLAIALCLSASDDTDTGATIDEVSGGSYARVTLNPGNANWKGTHNSTTGASSGTGGTVKNAVDITFPTATADWGDITDVAILDSATLGAGNLLYYGPLGATKTVANGDTFKFLADALQIQIDN